MRSVLTAWSIVCLAALVAKPAWAPPDVVFITAPGPSLGKTEAEWLLPYVRYLNEGVATGHDEDCACCGVGRPRVAWYAEDGRVLRELEDVSRSVGFLELDDRIIGLAPAGSFARSHFPYPAEAVAVCGSVMQVASS
jgi:hypothetical protein